jgi:hypothetical protein
MVAVVCLIFLALFLCIILLVRGTAKSRNPAPQPKDGEIRHENPRATGLN